MERLEMLQQAKRLAREMVDGIAALGDEHHATLEGLNDDERAVQRLAYEFLIDASQELEA